MITAAAFLAAACGREERERLQSQVDSLQIELETSQQMASTLQEVGALIDSIDQSRQVLRTNVIEGTSYTDYTARLAEINKHIRNTEAKLAELEQNLQTSKSSANSYAATVRRLRSDIEKRTQEIAALQAEIQSIREQNQSLSATITSRDSLLTAKTEIIRVNEEDIAEMERNIEEMMTSSRMKEAELYYAQAQALEEAADRTKFAPRKKKETQAEALELYRMALSLGMTEAQQRISELEDALS